MGTRSLTRVIQVWYNEEEKKREEITLTTMYRQYDGYMSGHGVDLAEWLSKFSIVNGISLAEERQVANGADCLAAQMFAHFKDGAGGIYLMHPDAENCGEEYIYNIYIPEMYMVDGEDSEIDIVVTDVYKEKIIFHGSPQKLLVNINQVG